MLYFLAVLIAKPIILLLYRPKVINRQALRQRGKVIYVSNHMVLFDPVVIGVLVNRFIHFMAKASLSRKPFSAWVFRSLLTFPVEQYTADRKAIQKAIDLLNAGKAFGVFPEGHRSADGTTMDSFDKGCAFIAQRANAPIVPVYVKPGAWKLGKRMHVAVGDPIYPEQIKQRCPGRKPVDALNMAITDAMMTLRDKAENLA